MCAVISSFAFHQLLHSNAPVICRWVKDCSGFGKKCYINGYQYMGLWFPPMAMHRMQHVLLLIHLHLHDESCSAPEMCAVLSSFAFHQLVHSNAPLICRWVKDCSGDGKKCYINGYQYMGLWLQPMAMHHTQHVLLLLHLHLHDESWSAPKMWF